MNHFQKTSAIRKEIIQSYSEYKTRYPVLKYQNAIGLGIFLLSILMILTASYLWHKDILSVWILVPFNAFWMGILHELEHDLIHWMYFKNRKWVHHSMLFVVWVMRPLTVNPWLRRTLHYHHHKFSGSKHDVEERGVTNGERWGLKRLLTTPDIVVGGLMRLKSLLHDLKNEVETGNLKAEQAAKLRRYIVVGLFPLTVVAHIMVYFFLGYLLWAAIAPLFGSVAEMPALISGNLFWLKTLFYWIVLPNVLRQFCLHLITSNMHYFGDVEPNNVMEQTQVLNVWWTFPFQLFCFFFGWTHTIHHFVVNETFYIRHFTRKKAHEVLRRYGVRFNDLGTFKRANRFRTDAGA